MCKKKLVTIWTLKICGVLQLEKLSKLVKNIKIPEIGNCACQYFLHLFESNTPTVNYNFATVMQKLSF